jgi:hypothetical protein
MRHELFVSLGIAATAVGISALLALGAYCQRGYAAVGGEGLVLIAGILWAIGRLPDAARRVRRTQKRATRASR